MIERNIGCLQTRDSDDARNAAGGQIGQTEKTQGAFIVYENVLFIRGKVKKLTEKCRKKWLANLRLWSTGAGVPQQ